MDSIPVIDSQEQEYIVCDRNFRIVKFSSEAAKYADQAIIIGEDLRTSFPEIVGLESTCQEILRGRQKNFSLETISRPRESNQILYFNLLIKAQGDHLVILLSDVTASTLLQQLSSQRINDAEITLNKLQRFEYCTNKIISSMQDVLLITSPQGIIERVNKSCTELFKQKKSELINQSIDNLIQDPSFNHQNIYNSLLTSQDAVNKIEVNFVGKQEQTIQIEFDCFIAPTEVKNFFNCVYIGRDITARKQAEDEIRKSLAREKELRELKSGFISMASHEFRNPLSSILLCVQNLRESDGISGSNREFYLQSIQDAALTMNSLLEDVLVLSKAESDKQQLKLEPINLQEFCQKIIQKLTSIYNNKQVYFDYQAEIKLIDLDRTTLRNIVDNLLSNALKYSVSDSTVSLIISHVSESAEIKIEVRDRGIGIPLESQKHLFESFYRASNVNSIPGTGLGLSIVKKSVDLYQGSITVTSEVNQ
ncbi:MAG: PAS domain-containing sensor histidine kinase, partial [Cyanobacteria bacterium P01_E01_bin.35]